MAAQPVDTATMSTLSEIQDRQSCATFKELDLHYGLTKGSSFRAFKRQLASWTEGVEFICCDARSDAAAFARLAEQGRLYPSTVNAVLITPVGRSMLDAVLGAPRVVGAVLKR